MLGTRKDNMSKLGDVRLQLDEAAERLGFESLEQAQQAGCEVEWEGNTAKLVEPLELAHREWEKEKGETLEGLAMVSDNLPAGGDAQQAVERAIRFIKEAHE